MFNKCYHGYAIPYMSQGKCLVHSTVPYCLNVNNYDSLHFDLSSMSHKNTPHFKTKSIKKGLGFSPSASDLEIEMYSTAI